MTRLRRPLAVLVLAVLLAVEGRAYAETLVDRPREGYVLFVPDAPAGSGGRALVVCLPGTGVDARTDLENWKSQARLHGFLLADVHFDYNRILSAAAVEDCQSAIESAVRASKKYGAKSSHVYLGGSSAGGMLAIALSLKFPYAYRGVGVLGGGKIHEAWVSEKDLRNARGQHYYLIQGEKDTVVSTGMHRDTLWLLGQNGAITSYVRYPNFGHSLPVSAYEEIGAWFRRLDEVPVPRTPWKIRWVDFFMSRFRRVKRVLAAGRWDRIYSAAINFFHAGGR